MVSQGDLSLRFAISVGTRTVDDSSDLRHAVGLLEPGEMVSLNYYRDGTLRSGIITVGEADPGES